MSPPRPPDRRLSGDTVFGAAQPGSGTSSSTWPVHAALGGRSNDRRDPPAASLDPAARWCGHVIALAQVFITHAPLLGNGHTRDAPQAAGAASTVASWAEITITMSGSVAVLDDHGSGRRPRPRCSGSFSTPLVPPALAGITSLHPAGCALCILPKTRSPWVYHHDPGRSRASSSTANHLRPQNRSFMPG